MSKGEFSQLLTEGIRSISIHENKPLHVIEDEISFALGRSSNSAIRYWRKGNPPSKPDDVEALAAEIIRRGKMSYTWLERFLRNASYPDVNALCERFFPRGQGSYLPAPPNPLLGRQPELNAAQTLLTRSGVRLLTLTGAPGVGKTRLAIQLAHQVRPAFQDGVGFVSLSAITDTRRVPSAIAEALGLVESSSPNLEMRLRTYLQGREMLLLLDNFEHILGASPQVSQMLSAAPGLKILVTSREPLHLYGEHEFSLSPLKLPPVNSGANTPTSLDVIASAPAVQLFVSRAVAVQPLFELTSENVQAVMAICTRLDGLPLAIELAATHSKWMTPDEILAALEDWRTLLVSTARDVPMRQQSLWAAIDWSYRLLDESEKKVFRRLGMFMGGASLASVAGLCQAARLSVQRILEGLVEKNLVQCARQADPENPYRYTLLESLREYACFQLQESGETDFVRQLHRDECVRLAEAAGPHLRSAQQVLWLNRLDLEIHNLRAALAASLETPESVGAGLRILAASHWFWHLRSYRSEELAWTEKLLAQPADASPATRRARARVMAMAGLASMEVDPVQGNALFKDSLAILQETGDRNGAARVLSFMALAALRKNDLQQVQELAGQAQVLYQETGDRFGLAELLDFPFAALALSQGDYALAAAHHQRALALRQELGDIDGTAWSMSLLARTFRASGEEAQAQKLLEECTLLWQQVGNRREWANTLCELGSLALQRGEYEQALASAAEGLAIFEAIATPDDAGRALALQAMAACEAGQTAMAYASLQRLTRLVHHLGSSPLASQFLTAAAALACQSGDPARAARLLGAARANSRSIFAQVTNLLWEQAWLPRIRQALGETVFEQAFAEGQQIPLDEAIARALENTPTS